MRIEQTPIEKSKDAAHGLRKATETEEKKVAARKGSDLAKGAKRFEERSKGADIKSAGVKHRGRG